MEPKDKENETPIDNVQADIKTPGEGDGTPKTDTPEDKAPTAEEIALWKKKAEDFDGMVEKQKLSKLNKQKPSDGEGLSEQIVQLQQEVANLKQNHNESILTQGFNDFKSKLPWAVTDEFFNEISKEFSAEGLSTKEEIAKKLEAITISKFPEKYSDEFKKNVEKKALAEAANISAGNGGAPSNNQLAKGQEKIDPLEALKKRMASNLPKGYSAIKK